MDSGIIRLIDKAILYAKEPERIVFESFSVTFEGNHRLHHVDYDNGKWQCNCSSKGICSHIRAIERILMGSVNYAE